MKSIKNEVVTTLEIKKSKFINYLIPVSDVDQVADILQGIHKLHYNATHHTYAYIIGDNQEHQKCSDDGEPSKTAGYPMLDVLKKNELTNLINISVRYFGGIKLGVGGLIRAYVKSCTNGLDNSLFTSLQRLVDLSIKIPFDAIGNVEQYLRDNYTISNTAYDNAVTYFLTILEEDLALIQQHLSDSTKGVAEITVILQYEKFQ